MHAYVAATTTIFPFSFCWSKRHRKDDDDDGKKEEICF
jgi:hypothetical protein